MEQLVITGIILLLIVILEIFLYCKLIKVSKWRPPGIKLNMRPGSGTSHQTALPSPVPAGTAYGHGPDCAPDTLS